MTLSKAQIKKCNKEIASRILDEYSGESVKFLIDQTNYIAFCEDSKEKTYSVAEWIYKKRWSKFVDYIRLDSYEV